MNWMNILKNAVDLKNKIDEFDKTQNKNSGPLIITLDESSTQGPYKTKFGSHRIYVVTNDSDFKSLRNLYSQTYKIHDKQNAFFVMGKD
jgi:hypothetical protein